MRNQRFYPRRRHALHSAFFRTDRFDGELKSSDEGRVFWIERDELTQYKLSHDFIDMVHVMENPSLTEFFYERDGEIWKKRII